MNCFIPSVAQYAMRKQRMGRELGVESTIIPYTVEYYSQTINHFGDCPTQNNTYPERYLISDQYFGGHGYPLVFYTGNEGDITWFWNNTGFAFALARKYQALVVFAEHRYYGDSKPFGEHRSFEQGFVQYLSVEQALADYAQLIPALRASYNFGKVLALGGSYGGMLAAWFRMSYPDVVDASLAGSGPIVDFLNEKHYNMDLFNQIISNDFAQADSTCFATVQRAFTLLQSMPLADITSTFNLC